jgi:alkanesulfonate monooxygenase SsuD/methylene tetrahydromethanopterin reductase-like flavin-dependent oxidoreductase (luciferase family)
VPVDSGADRHQATPADPLSRLSELCRRVEALGVDALWACDHLFWHGPSLEAMVALTVAATATAEVTLGTSVIQLPLRKTAVVAKQAATLQLLSGGRFVLGVGVGSHAGEYEQAGSDFHARGRQLDAGIVELRQMWASGHGVTAGDTRPDATAADRYRQLPAPPTVPVWVGGSSEAALRRAARLADGWMPFFLDLENYQGALERLAKEVDRAGRPSDAVTPAMVLFVSVDDDPVVAEARGTAWMSSLYAIPAKAFRRHLVSGSAHQVAEVVAAYRRAGAAHVAVYVTADQPLEQFERLSGALAAVGAPTSA